jgi:Fe2+ transport system protein FeoA
VVAVGAGPVVLNVMGSRIVLGHGMANQVRVRPAPPAPHR